MRVPGRASGAYCEASDSLPLDATPSKLLEEVLIMRAHEDGLVDILRPPDARFPSAVLGVVVAKAQAQVA